MRLNVVDLDDGYKAYYVDGVKVQENSEHDIPCIFDLIRGKTIEEAQYRFLGGVGREALYDRHMPEKYEDIPEEWWNE